MAHLLILFAAFVTVSLTLADSPYYGGFALSVLEGDGEQYTCPVGTLTCSNKIYTFCCPNFTFCGPFQGGAYCCPTADDCGIAVNAGLTCADPSWTLYEDAFDWCCASDRIGIALSDGECKPKGGTYSYYASTVTQSNSAPPPSSWIGGVPSGVSISSSAAAATTTTTAADQTPITNSASSTVSSAAVGKTTSSSGAVIQSPLSIIIWGVVLGEFLMVVMLL